MQATKCHPARKWGEESGQWLVDRKDDGEAVSTTHPLLSTTVRNELKSVETEIKYAGYLDQQTKSIERLKKVLNHGLATTREA